MSKTTHQPTPTVGQVLKKIMAINPDLTSHELIQVMRQSIVVRGGYFHDGFSKQDTIDEAKAIELTRSTLR